jgi:hypothetical protein
MLYPIPSTRCEGLLHDGYRHPDTPPLPTTHPGESCVHWRVRPRHVTQWFVGARSGLITLTHEGGCGAGP